MSSSLCNFLQSPVTSSVLGPSYLFRTLFGNTLNLCSSLVVRNQTSHPYKTTGKLTVCYCHSQLCQIFKRVSNYVHNMILSCIQVIRHKHTLNFFFIYFQINFLLESFSGFVQLNLFVLYHVSSVAYSNHKWDNSGQMSCTCILKDAEVHCHINTGNCSGRLCN
jgi:hypothetical protein